MANGDSAPDMQTVLADENFKSLPLAEKDKVLTKIDSNYAGLPGRERAHALAAIHYGREATQEPEPPKGSAALRSAYGVGRGMNNVVEGIYQTIIHPINTASAIATQIEEFPGKIMEASKEPSTVGKAAKIGAAVPVFGPLGQQLGERAGKGDVAGAVSEGLTTAVFPSLAKRAIKAVAPKVTRATLEVPKKIDLPGGFKINRNIPPPPEEVAYTKAKTITEAQEAAQAENVKRSASAAKSREAAFNKEAEERMAIQRRADEATEARMQAEKEAKNARLKSEQAHERELKEYEAARQKDLTAAEKLKDQHAEALQRRGREQAALDKAAKRAGEVEVEARQAVAKLPPERPGSSDVRPTASEKYLTQLIKKTIISPNEYATLRQELGADAAPMRGESHGRWQARVLGLIRSGRAARGMRDITSGPSMPPPPSPEPSAPTPSGRNPIASSAALEESSTGLRRRFDPEGKLTDEQVASKARRAQRRMLEDKLGITQPVGEE